MTGFVFFGLIALLVIVMIGCHIDNVVYKPIRMTSPPVDKILTLIKDLNGFKVHSGGYLVPEKISNKTFVDWTLEDTKTGELTWMYEFVMNDNVSVYGDLSWMNAWEQRRLYDVVEAIGKAQNKVKAEQKEAAYTTKCNQRREEAKKVYQDR